jgi:hypothetical protein
MGKKLSQKDLLYNLLQDGHPHSTVEIMERVYGGSHLGLARAGARINDLVNLGYVFLDKYGREITGSGVKRGWKDENNPTIYWYRMKIKQALVLNPQVYSPEFIKRQEGKRQGVLI